MGFGLCKLLSVLKFILVFLDFRHRQTVKVTDLEGSSPNLSENEDTGKEENGEVPHLSRYTFLDSLFVY